MSKYDLAQALQTDIPEGLMALFDTGKLGSFASLAVPSTEEDAVICMGQFCAEVQNNLLVPLSGLPVVQALLYLGALNPAVIASLFAGLEGVEGASGPFDVIAPKNGGVYPGFFDNWTVRAPGSEEMTVTVAPGTEDEESFDLTQNDGIWTAQWPMPIGDHSAVFSDGAESMTVSFSVVSWSVYPPEDAVISEGDVEVTVDTGDITPEKIDVVITNNDTGDESLLELIAGETVAVLTAGAHTFFATVLLPASIGGTIHQLRHDFTVVEGSA